MFGGCSYHIPTVGASASFNGAQFNLCNASGSVECTNSFSAPTAPGTYSIGLTGCYGNASNCAASSIPFTVACSTGTCGQTNSGQPNTTPTISPTANSSHGVIPSVSCSGTPGNPFAGQPVTWSSSVTGGSGSYTYVWSGTDNLFGTDPTIQTTYATPGQKNASLTVTDANSGKTASATCAVVNVSACTASITPGDNVIDQGGNTSVSWKVTGGQLCASSCTGNVFDTGGKIYGTENNVSIPTPPTLILSCSCAAGSTCYGPPAPASQNVAVIAPTATITANGQTGTTRVNQATSLNTTIAWQSGGDAVSCTGTNFSTGGAVSGSIKQTTTSQTVYTVTCENKYGASASDSVIVNILPIYNQF
ncbi:MAG TPA: PKD domain-containing protein [Candidatus Paceibacterota bacterium]|nr:PKD domain-containing protein [Candidatus Paceibacterota bacterium]